MHSRERKKAAIVHLVACKVPQLDAQLFYTAPADHPVVNVQGLGALSALDSGARDTAWQRVVLPCIMSTIADLPPKSITISIHLGTVLEPTSKVSPHDAL